MIVDRIRNMWKAEAERRRPGGTPTGARWGSCTAMLEQLMFPEVTHPEPMQPRGVGVMRHGVLIHEAMSRDITSVWPGRWGLREQPFYLRVPIPPEAIAAGACERIREKLKPRQPTKGDDASWRRTPVWGWPHDGFVPPKIELTADRKLRIGGGLGDPRERYAASILLDMHPADGAVDPCVWCRTDVDGIVLHPELGLTLIEIKSMSDAGFRRAAAGELEYSYRCQLAGTMTAVGVESAVWVIYRKQTCHMAEVSFAPSAEGTRVTLTGPNGLADQFIVVDPRARTLRKLGSAEVTPWLPDSEWEIADVWTPALAAETLIPDIHRRVLNALTARPGEPLHREYGPIFTCPRCAGEGDVLCRYCKGTGVGLASGKPCGGCGAKGKRSVGKVGRLACTPTRNQPSCGGGGVLETTRLPWQCSYCSAVMGCWGAAGVTRIIDNGRPLHLVQRHLYEASGLRFTPPVPIVTEPAVEDDEEEADEP